MAASRAAAKVEQHNPDQPLDEATASRMIAALKQSDPELVERARVPGSGKQAIRDSLDELRRVIASGKLPDSLLQRRQAQFLRTISDGPFVARDADPASTAAVVVNAEMIRTSDTLDRWLGILCAASRLDLEHLWRAEQQPAQQPESARDTYVDLLVTRLARSGLQPKSLRPEPKAPDPRIISEERAQQIIAEATVRDPDLVQRARVRHASRDARAAMESAVYRAKQERRTPIKLLDRRRSEVLQQLAAGPIGMLPLSEEKATAVALAVLTITEPFIAEIQSWLTLPIAEVDRLETIEEMRLERERQEQGEIKRYGHALSPQERAAALAAVR